MGAVMAIELSNIDDALDFLNKIVTQSTKWNFEKEPIRFSEELGTLVIEIHGPQFHNEITGEMARALAAYQDSIYDFAKSVIYEGEGHSYKRLTAEVREAFQLEFEIEDGCLQIKANLKKVFDAVADHIRDKMDSEILASLLVKLAVIGALGVTGYFLGSKYLDNVNAQVEKEHVEAVIDKVSDGNQKILDKVNDLLSTHNMGESDLENRLVASFDHAQANGLKEIAKAAPEAQSIDFGKIHLDADDIKELNSRSPRAVSEPFVSVGEFIVTAETTPGLTNKLTFRGKSLPDEVTVEHTSGEFDSLKEDALWKAIRLRTPIRAKIQATLIRDKVRGGVLVDLLPEID